LLEGDVQQRPATRAEQTVAGAAPASVEPERDAG
jgi:hypothetical protein